MSEMPWPWMEMWRSELDMYRRIKENDGNLTDAGITAGIAKYTNNKRWTERIPKAAFFGSYRPLRRLIWDQAALRPDLIDAPFHLSNFLAIEPWNKNSKEPSPLHGDAFREYLKRMYSNNNNTKTKIPQMTSQPGFLSFLANVSLEKEKSYHPGEFIGCLTSLPSIY